MLRLLLFFACGFFFALHPVRADGGPPVAITAPEKAQTFIHAKIKSRALSWDHKKQVLEATITFLDDDPTGESNLDADDSHTFTFPGCTFNPKLGLFYAPSQQGGLIPVAKIKKILFLTEIHLLPNAQVQIDYPHGEVEVSLVALQPDDPRLQTVPSTNQDQAMDPGKLLR